MKELFSIGEMAKLYGLNYRTLRYYDDIGLLKPEYINPETNYRYYSTRQFEALNTILYLREIDVPIRKIQEFFMEKDAATLLSLFKRQQEEISRKRERLERVEKKIHNRILMLEDTLNSPLEKIEERLLPRRTVAVLREEFRQEDDIEYPLRKLGGMDPKNLVTFPGKVGLSISPDHLKNGCYDVYSSVFILLEPEDCYTGDITEWPPQPCLNFRFSGTRKEARRYYPTLLTYLDEHGYELAGEALEFALIDYCLTGDEETYVTQLQLPFRCL
ncbi:MAG: MerR family transcriptional regulator [Clostridiales bacterium]|nr:MerR family transcriptional regulator [Clostridiales bacterium]